MLNGVLVTFLVDNQVYNFGPVQIGWLLGIPVLAGSVFRLPAGILTDKFGGKWVYGLLLIGCAIPMFLLSKVNGFWSYAICSFGFGLTGVSFAIGIAFSSYWYPKQWQGTALGIFGAGNAGAALTTLLAPSALKYLTDNGTNLDAWRQLPQIYATVLLVMGIVFILFVKNKKPDVNNKRLIEFLRPLKNLRVWRFGLYYFLVFGMFVAFSQWLVPYFVNVYYLPLVTAGIFAALFSFPSGVIRVLGGVLSDRWGARIVMYWILGSSVIISLMMSVPKMDIITPGNGIMAKAKGEVTFVSSSVIRVGEKEYLLKPKPPEDINTKKYKEFHIFPVKSSWQNPIVTVGQMVNKKELLATGETHIMFQANVWIFAILVILIGSIWGIGKAAVYKHIPDYFPNEVGVVGGMVGLLGGLGGFFGPIIFGYLLEYTGIWTTCWMFMFFLSVVCLIWMYMVIKKMMNKEVPNLMRKIEEKNINN
jgi:NNP family nitrate/nitrite transporter-like MFS transporter